MSLTHHGMLLLDERLKFRRHALEVLRQPLEDGVVTIARTAMSVTFSLRGGARRLAEVISATQLCSNLTTSEACNFAS